MIKYDLFESIQHVKPHPRNETYEQFAERITYFDSASAKQDRKKCFSFTMYHPGRTRGKENISAMTGLVLDFDNKIEIPTTVGSVTSLLQQKEIMHFWYHTYSHTEEVPKWRLILPFNESVILEDWDNIFERCLLYLGEPEGIDPASKRAAQIYFFPYMPPNSITYFQGEACFGKLLAPYSLAKMSKKIKPNPKNEQIEHLSNEVKRVCKENDFTKAESALRFISPDIDYNDWIRIGMALQGAFGGRGFDLWNKWSKEGSKYKGRDDLAIHWTTFQKTGLSLGTLLLMAKERGYNSEIINQSEIRQEKLVKSRRNKLLEPEEISETEEEGQEATYSYEDLTEISIRRLECFVEQDIFKIPCPTMQNLYQWIENCSIIHQPLYSLATALSIMAFLKRNMLVSSTKLKTNLYILAIGPSRSGKNNGLERIYQIMTALELDSMLTSGIGSHQGMLRQLNENKGALFWKQDELAYIFKSFLNAHTSPNEQKIEQKLLTLYNCKYQTTDTIKSEKVESVKDPFLNIYSTSTEQILEVLKPQTAVSGLLARFLIFWVPPGLPYDENLSPVDVIPKELLSALKEISKENMIKTTIMEPEAQEWFKKFLKEVRLIQRELSEARTQVDSLVGNLPEQAMKIALLSIPIHRISSDSINPNKIIKERWPYMRLPDIQWGVAVALHCLRNNITIAHSFSDNTNEKIVKKILEKVKEKTKNGTWIKKSQLWQAVRYIANSRQLDEILELLSEAGEIERAENEYKRGYKVRIKTKTFVYREEINDKD
jgi:hypothetical protein